MTVGRVRKYAFASTATRHRRRAGCRGACCIYSQLLSFSPTAHILPTPLPPLHLPLLSLLSTHPSSLSLPSTFRGTVGICVTSFGIVGPTRTRPRRPNQHRRPPSTSFIGFGQLAGLQESKRVASYTSPSQPITSTRLASLRHSFNGACITLCTSLSDDDVATPHRNVDAVFDDFEARCAGVV